MNLISVKNTLPEVYHTYHDKGMKVIEHHIPDGLITIKYKGIGFTISEQIAIERYDQVIKGIKNELD